MTRPTLVQRGSDGYPAPAPGPVVTVGNFDGVHLGHRALVDAARKLAGPEGVVCAYTFDPFPRDVMAPGHGVPAIQSLDDRVACLGEAGADHVVVEPFTKAYAAIGAEAWIDELLLGRLGATGLVVGWDFRFGRRRAGDVELLRRRLAIPVVQVPRVRVDGEGVSSTRVREVVRTGDVAHAARLLGRPHVVRGAVVRGDARGRTIGFPTANVAPATPLVPAPGVYAVRAEVDGAWWGGVANLGHRPTFGPGAAPLEVHLFDFDADLYDRPLAVAFVDRIRDERRFDGIDALVAQIGRDAARAREILAEAP